MTAMKINNRHQSWLEIFLTINLAFLLNAKAFAEVVETRVVSRPVATIISVNGAMYTKALNKEEAKQSPTWNGLGEPPLSIKEAVSIAMAIATRYAEGNNPLGNIPELQAVELKKLGLWPFWYYIVVIDPEPNSMGLNMPFQIIVLLNGKPVVPEGIKLKERSNKSTWVQANYLKSLISSLAGDHKSELLELPPRFRPPLIDPSVPKTSEP